MSGLRTAPFAQELATLLVHLDALLHREILRMRSRYQLSLDEFRGLYVTDEQVDALLKAGSGDAITAAAPATLLTALSQSTAGLNHLARRFPLTPLELAVLLVAVAPALDPKYDTLYAYLNNDVTRRLASMDLVLRLLSEDESSRLTVRAALLPDAGLIASGLLRLQPFREGVSGAAQQRAVCAHEGLAGFLLGLPLYDERLRDLMGQHPPREIYWAGIDQQRLLTAAQRLRAAATTGTPRVVRLEAETPHRPLAFAQALAATVGRTLYDFDVRSVARDTLREHLVRATLFARINDAALFVHGTQSLIEHEGRAVAEALQLRSLLQVRYLPVMLDLDSKLIHHHFQPGEVLKLRLSADKVTDKRAVWSEALTDAGLSATARDVEDIAARFRLGRQAIEATMRELSDDTPPEASQPVDRDSFFAAARHQSDTVLARLAQQVSIRHEWDDLVLPSVTKERIRSFIDALAMRERVLDQWGMGRVLGTRGLRALFAGPSGTGKTMAAGVVARELGLDCYRIDLSQIVSKYIGETEKNLERIFQAAGGCNAVLFFDEADALFGKRSEVKDAHDRYANIEVAYLLQRIEDFDGAVILATNLSRNIDAAFARRMQFVVEFPLPGPSERQRIWAAVFPASAPLAADVDYEFLARRFELPGGDIRNIAVDAAFLAAQSASSQISMRDIVQALGRHLIKQGKVPTASDFKQYHCWLSVVG
jgi:hypothetical protein